MPTQEEAFGKFKEVQQETQQHEAVLKEARAKLAEAETLYEQSLGEYHRAIEQGKQLAPEAMDAAVKEYVDHLEKEADSAWEGDQYEEAVSLIERMRNLQKNYPESGEIRLTDEEERLIMGSSTAFYDRLASNLKNGNLHFVTTQFRALALLLKEKGEAIDDRSLEKISTTVEERLRATPATEIAKPDFQGWHKGNGQ